MNQMEINQLSSWTGDATTVRSFNMSCWKELRLENRAFQRHLQARNLVQASHWRIQWQWHDCNTSCYKSELNWFNWRNVFAFVSEESKSSQIIGSEYWENDKRPDPATVKLFTISWSSFFHMWLNESFQPCMMMMRQLKPSESLTTPWFLLITSDWVSVSVESVSLAVYWLSGRSDCGSCTAGSSATVGKWNWIKRSQKKPPNSTAISPAGFPISVEWIDSSWLSSMIHVMCEHLKFKGFQHSIDSIEVGTLVEDNQVRRILGHTGHHQPQVVVNLHMARPAIRLQHGWWFTTIFGIATHLAKPIDYWLSTENHMDWSNIMIPPQCHRCWARPITSAYWPSNAIQVSQPVTWPSGPSGSHAASLSLSSQAVVL